MDRFTILGVVERMKKKYLNSYSCLIFLLGVILIGGLWTFVQYQIRDDYDRAIEENSRETINLTKAFEEHVRRIVAEADKELLDLSHVYERDGLSSSIFNEYVERSEKDPSRTLVAIYDERGNIIKSSNLKSITENRSDRDYYCFHQNSNNHELYIGLPIVGRVNGQNTIPLTRRINKPDGTFGGIVYIGLSANYFLLYYQKIDLGNNQLLSLSGTDGYNRVRQVNDNFETGQNIMMGKFWEMVQSGRPNATYVSKNMLDGVSRITSYRVMPDYPLIVTIGKSTQVALANFDRRKQGYIIGASLVTLFILAFCSLLVTQYAKRQKMNSELSRLERLNLVGEMAAGIGHEIRNPLTTVRGYLQWYLYNEKYAELRMQFATMVEELDRANEIITEYLSLAKNKSIKLKLDNINNTLVALFPLLQAEAYNSGHALQIEKNDIPDIYMDGNEVRQLILNMVRNGFDAMESNGRLTIKSYREKDKVILAIRDTGSGISQSMLDKLGTPFLTTKDNGTGLGLAVCYQIAARHKAKIDVDTSTEGTTFYIKFELPK
ncbi:ATP-binding protein [Pelosinus sp. sgz500959]|uniref:ATP-binding protein n=1 Tax=Pelosinus sp. sgz500959 TaxID=3242472 RepID=UPI00367072AB